MIHARTTVYLNTAHESFFGFDHTAQLRLAATFDLAMTDITGAAITTSGALEHIFNQLNIPDPTAFWALKYRLSGHRSLSVGDVVVLGKTAFAVAGAGWDRITTDQLTAAIAR
jgi:hypothetical protein